ncbi:unnamed protein product, partial [Discosporangium mesarthrocarpum]
MLFRRSAFGWKVISRLPRRIVDAVLEETQLSKYFPHRVAWEDEPFDDYRGYMLAAIKVGRSTMKCCAFDCRQSGMIKAHDADMRGVCTVEGVMSSWEMKLADMHVARFDDLTMLNFRQLFADRDFEPGAPQVQLQPEEAPKRQVLVATKVKTRLAEDDEEPEPWADGEGPRGPGGGGQGRRGGGDGLRRRW